MLEKELPLEEAPRRLRWNRLALGLILSITLPLTWHFQQRSRSLWRKQRPDSKS